MLSMPLPLGHTAGSTTLQAATTSMTRHYMMCRTAVMYACLSSVQCLQCSMQAIHPLQPSSLPAVLAAMQLSRHAWLTLGHFLRVHADDTQAVDDSAL